MNSMYTLTAMTGKEASATRTVVIGTIEFNWRVWMILIWTAPLALIVTAMLWPLLGQIALVALPGVEGAALWLIHRRTRTGLRLRTYQAMWDKRKAAVDQFFLCGQPIEVDQSDYRTVMPNSTPYVAPAKAPAAALVDQLASVEPPPGVVPVAMRDLPAAPRPPALPPVARPAALSAPAPALRAPVAQPPVPSAAPVATPAPILPPAAPAPVVAPAPRPEPVVARPAPAPLPSATAPGSHRLDPAPVDREVDDVDVTGLFDEGAPTATPEQRRLFGRTKDHQ